MFRIGLCFCFLVWISYSSIQASVIANFQFEGNLINTVDSNSAVARGNPQFVPGIHGTALLVSTGNYAAITGANAFVPGMSSFSAAVRFKLTGVNSVTQWAALLSMQGGDFSEGAVLAVRSNSQLGDQLAIGLHDGSSYQEASYSHNSSLLDTWQHVAYVVNRSSSEVSLYLNGARVANSALNLGSIDPTFDYLIGQYDYVFGRNGHPRFVGGQDLIIDDLYLYDHALSDDDVADLALGSNATVPEPTTLLCLAPVAIYLAQKTSAQSHLSRRAKTAKSA